MQSKSRLQSTIEYLLDNFVDIITMLLAGILVIRYYIQSPDQRDITELTPWILTILGLIAISGLWDRNRRLKRIEAASEEGRDLVKRYTGRHVRADDFLKPGREIFSQHLNEAIDSANIIQISGITLMSTTKKYSSQLIRRLNANALVRIIIVDTEESVLQQIVRRSWGTINTDQYLNRLKNVETLIYNIRDITRGKGKIELGHMQYIPAFGMIMLDPDQPNGTCFVEIYHHQSAEPEPAFEIRAADDPTWFEFFRIQFGLLWNRCRLETGLESKEEVTSERAPDK